MTTTDLDLSAFCHPGLSRYSLEKPFVRGGYLVATDGTKCVLIPTDEPDTEGRKVPNVLEFLGKRPSARTMDWPAAVYADKVSECRRCKGTGAAHTRDCDHCDGTGEIECDHCHSEVDCDECDGEGTINCGTCKTCEGKKTAMQPYAIEVGGRLISFVNDVAIRALPGVRFIDDCKPDDLLWFEFDGGFGMVMPLSRD